MPACVDVDVKGIFVDDHESLNRSISHTGFWIPRDDNRRVKIRSSIFYSVNGYRQGR